MKTFGILAALSALCAEVSGHYILQQISYGGTKYGIKVYVRPNTNYNSPVTDLDSNDLRCNEGGASGASTDTLAVTAGSAFTVFWDTAVYHNGPIAMYLAKAPSTAASFDGSGQVWFKFWERGPTFNPVTWPLTISHSASLPSGLPNGEYLLRVEQLGLHNPYPAALPQFYVGCAQISVSGGGSGTPGPLVSIPGHIKGNEPGYTVNIYNGFTSYSMLGPAVWNGGGSNPQPTTTAGPVVTTRPGVTTTTPIRPTTTTPVRPTTTPPTGGPVVAKYGQCGGNGWTGSSTCISGTTCTRANDFYSQCL